MSIRLFDLIVRVSLLNWGQVWRWTPLTRILETRTRSQSQSSGMTACPWTINYIETPKQNKCRLPKKLACKGTLLQVLLEFTDWRYSQPCWYFRPRFANCCPSMVSYPLSPPSLCEQVVYTYTYAVCKEGGEILGLRQINTCRKVPLQVIFLRWRHFALPSMSLIFLRWCPSVDDCCRLD